MKAMEMAMLGLLGVSTMVYIDNIIVFNKTIEDHLRDVEAVLDRLNRYNLKAKIKKCNFAFQRLPVLGFVVTPAGIESDPTVIKKVLEIPEPTGRKEVRAFMGMVNQFQPFIRRLSEIAKPLTALTSAKIAWKWGRSE